MAVPVALFDGSITNHTAAHFVKNIAVHIILFQASLQRGVFVQCFQVLRWTGQTEDEIKDIIACSCLGHGKKPTAEPGKIAFPGKHFCKGGI